ncbi:hypothetical protein [Arthrospiribacter ruber]|uniref:Uncharacterized protein n=1 Tax=Arthrospiribacter ruber TaxID=2487934 RepID=A0A951MEV7_9BACT|nr:hypothetical protein [Arthrospiribacter ruber]MBW3469482.1 hypothetical protein [Arthrospiribacter ruber]
MKQNLALGFALLVLVIGLFNFFKYVSDFELLSDYGKGYLSGSVIFILLGGILSFLIIRKKIQTAQTPE